MLGPGHVLKFEHALEVDHVLVPGYVPELGCVVVLDCILDFPLVVQKKHGEALEFAVV